MFFQTGGVSHVDSFDPKPALARDEKKKSKLNRDRGFKPSMWAHQPRGESGLEITNLFPHIGAMADDLCLIRSLHGDHGDHFEATLHMHTGSNGSALPGIGAWMSYGLGTANPNLPSHVVFADKQPYAGSQAWDSNFLPAYHQGVRIQPGNEPIPNLRPDDALAAAQPAEMKMLEKMNRRHFKSRADNAELAARILSFETAYSMQNLAPDLFDLSKETDHTLDLYGTKRDDNKSFGWQCLMARRMAERGVRFIEVIDTGSSGNWDAHSNIQGHGKLAKIIDQPIAGLLTDLKQRGLYEDTLVIWCTEFGRTPYPDSNPTGRGHHKQVFTCWLAGGGVKGGYAYGKSDEHGLAPAENPVHVHDFHATILHLVGMNHEQLTYHWAGRNFRLTDVHGEVIHDILT